MHTEWFQGVEMTCKHLISIFFFLYTVLCDPPSVKSNEKKGKPNLLSTFTFVVSLKSLLVAYLTTCHSPHVNRLTPCHTRHEVIVLVVRLPLSAEALEP